MQTTTKSTTPRLLASVEEERSALGAALLDAPQAAELIAHATMADFTLEAHRLIFDAMRRLGPPLELNTIASELQRAGQLDRVGLGSLAGLDFGVVPELPMSGRRARLRDLTQLRELRKLGDEIHILAQTPFMTAVQVFTEIRRRLEEIGSAT